MTTNEYIIEKYKGIEDIQKFYYKDNGGILDGVVLPNKIDNRHLSAPTDNQGNTSQCACYSICNIFESYYWKFTGKLINLNPEQVYAGAKLLDHDKNGDGTYLECAIQSAWSLCGFRGSPKIGFIYNDKTENTLMAIKRAVHSYDFVHAGFMIRSGWFNKSQNDYIIDNSGSTAGGHAVVINYYDTESLAIQNSWGRNWGTKGMAVIPNKIALDQLMYCCYIENIYNQFI